MRNIIKDITSVLIAVVAFGILPIYNEPFGGCEVSGCFTMALGCSSWPEFVRGFLLIAPLAILAKNKLPLSTLGLIVALVISVLGGAEMIHTGEALSYAKDHYTKIIMHLNQPFFVGSLIAYIFYISLRNIIGVRNCEVKNA